MAVGAPPDLPLNLARLQSKISNTVSVKRLTNRIVSATSNERHFEGKRVLQESR